MPELEFAEKIEAEVLKAEKPDGAPDMIPFKAVPRRRRAELMRKLTALQEREAEVKAVRGDNAEAGATPEQAAVVFDFLADLEELLVEAAMDPEAFTAWANSCEDRELTALFGWYVTTFQVGE